MRGRILTIAAALLVGCGQNPGPVDGGSPSDAGDVLQEGALDAGTDAGTDVGTDAGSDAPGDGGVAMDAGGDVAPEGGDSGGAADACAAVCNGACVDTQTDPMNCGGCGAVCGTTAFGHAVCSGGNCGIACSAGYHVCNAACSSDNSVDSCGASCTPCPSANGTATCDGTHCGITCNAGYHVCGGACADDTSINSCGTSCAPCPSDPNGTTTCDGTRCGLTCAAGFVPAAGGCVAIPAPRQVAPLSTATVTSQQPTLRWELGAGSDGAHIQLCRDRAMTQQCRGFNAVGSSGAPLATLGVGLWYWRAYARSGTMVGTTPSPVWQFTVGARSAAVNTSWGTTLDVNGDGYADVIVGAPGANNYLGNAYVYLGSATGISTTPSTVLAGSDASGQFGSSVASAGDVNGDGYADVIVGAFQVSASTGRAYVYLGSAAGISTTPSAVLIGPDGAGGFFGSSVASVGDTNADGYADVIVGAFAVNNSAGRAYVYLGSAAGISTTPSTTLDQAGGGLAYFGNSVASAGDLNGDGYADAIVGASRANGDVGAAYVYLGSAAGLSATPFTSMTGLDGAYGSFGASVACAGDVNGDGYADMIVGASGAGKAYLYFARASGLSNMPSASLMAPNGTSAYFGASVAGAGDVNGDGYADVLVGAFGTNSDTGTVHLYVGSASGILTTALSTVVGPDSGGQFGRAVAGAGDVNGDGYADAFVGAYVVNNSTGKAYLYPGSGTGLSSTPLDTLTGLDGARGEFGVSVASAEGADGHSRGETAARRDARGARGFACGAGRKTSIDPT